MKVLSKIADRADALLDDASQPVLALVGSGEAPSSQEKRVVKRLLGWLIPALILLPVALSTATGAALALPLGVALVGSVSLLILFFGAWLARLSGRESVAAPDVPADHAWMPGLVLRLDPQARIVSMGGRDASFYQSFLREPLERPFIDQVHVTDRIAFIRAIDALRQGESERRVSLRLGRPQADDNEGKLLPIDLDMTAERDATGALTGIFAQMLDRSRERGMAETLAALEIEVQDAHEAKSRFLAAVSHELRTPLNAILGFSDILASDLFGRIEDERHREYIRLIRQSGGHLLSVVNTMLDMCRIEAGRYELIVEPFPVRETVQDCEKMLALQAREKGVLLTSRVARDLGELQADPRALRQILINLVGNAIKFTETGGVVTIDAARSSKDVVLSVSDTGIGIAADRIVHLGQPFTQLDGGHARRHDGVGLGLSLVKGLVALHGGQFSITSRPGEGTVVTITLPLDGSGAKRVESLEDHRRIEFPPRLQANLQEMQPEETERAEREGLNDDAKAKIA
ncbi:sensor histidine kinase [Rhizobium paknamense]|uniref:histidine kinase n=1 Tax=Rhizobium paknamense TaxID=1206817 RepID=A0ABU0IAP0_9HYPH|nr:HAMP domain-containing sensor histidine kinase [Rhizobium paknamense]MDQ0454314.1 cell cycle sensor histidine kinase DivJ [Rhizobium paknamense]